MHQKVFIDNARELFCNSFLILPNVSSKILSTIEMILSCFSQELAWVQQQDMLDVILLHLVESSNDSPVIGCLPMFVVKEYYFFRYSLINMRQLQILFNQTKTWHRIVCWFSWISLFLPVLAWSDHNCFVLICSARAELLKTGKFS